MEFITRCEREGNEGRWEADSTRPKLYTIHLKHPIDSSQFLKCAPIYGPCCQCRCVSRFFWSTILTHQKAELQCPWYPSKACIFGSFQLSAKFAFSTQLFVRANSTCLENEVLRQGRKCESALKAFRCAKRKRPRIISLFTVHQSDQ